MPPSLPPHIPVIGDLVSDEQRLEIGCAVCRHSALWSPEDAVAKLGAGTTFLQARDRLRCSRCGTRNGDRGLIQARGSIKDFYERLRRMGINTPR